MCINNFGDSGIIFQEYTSVTFKNNIGNNRGGVTFAGENSNIVFKNDSVVLFEVNSAGNRSGSITALTSNITFEENAVVAFINNHADVQSGGAIHFSMNSIIAIRGNSLVMFYNNS